MPNLPFVWGDGSTRPTLHTTQPRTYFVTVSNICYDFIDSAAIINKVCDNDAPKVISLSSQEDNNLLFVKSTGATNYKYLIVNRWGMIVAEMNSISTPWTGKDRSEYTVSEGVYFYTIEPKHEVGQEISKQGFIQVVH